MLQTLKSQESGKLLLKLLLNGWGTNKSTALSMILAFILLTY